MRALRRAAEGRRWRLTCKYCAELGVVRPVGHWRDPSLRMEAVPLIGWRRIVRGNVPQMGLATNAADLDPDRQADRHLVQQPRQREPREQSGAPTDAPTPERPACPERKRCWDGERRLRRSWRNPKNGDRSSKIDRSPARLLGPHGHHRCYPERTTRRYQRRDHRSHTEHHRPEDEGEWIAARDAVQQRLHDTPSPPGQQ